MEVAKAETREEYSLLVKFTWKIKNFSTLKTDKLSSDPFTAGGLKWRIALYPEGNQKWHIVDHLSIYLEAADLATLPDGWTKRVKFRLSVVNQDKDCTVKREGEKAFNASKNGWGFLTFMPLDELCEPKDGFLVDDTCTVRAEIWCNEEQEKGEMSIKEKADLNSVESSGSFAEFDALFTDIQNLVEVKTSEADNSSNFSDKEITDAQKIVKQCLNMDPSNVIRSGKASELKNSLSILLITKEFRNRNKVDEATKFLADFEQRCEKYEDAQRDLSEAQENECSVSELKTTLKQLSSKFMPVRHQAEAVDSEIARLKKLLTERARLWERLKDLAGQATASKQALVCAEQKSKLSTIKKEQAKKMIEDFEGSWKSLAQFDNAF